ncbi:MAG: DsbA family oxidoreductase [Nitriliruptoraceae bacterium]
MSESAVPEFAASEPLTVHVWSDVACPWCYIGKRHLEDGIVDFVESGTPPVDVTFHSFLLSPDTPEDFEGSALDFLVDHKGITRDGAARLQDEVARVAAEAGLQFDFSSQQVASTRKAHQVLHLAYDRGLQYDLKERLLRAHFCEGRHVGRDDDLVDLAADVGLDAAEVRGALDDGRYQPAVEQDLELARSLGVTGVPFFVIDRRFAITGAQPAAVFSEVLARAVASREASAD